MEELRNVPESDKDDEYEEKVVRYNKAMRELTRLNFLYDDGLPTRQIFKNLIVAAAVDNGYGNKYYRILGMQLNLTVQIILLIMHIILHHKLLSMLQIIWIQCYRYCV